MARANNKQKTTAKSVIAAAIYLRGIDNLDTKDLAARTLCSEAYVKSIIKKVKEGKLIIESKVIIPIVR